MTEAPGTKGQSDTLADELEDIARNIASGNLKYAENKLYALTREIRRQSSTSVTPPPAEERSSDTIPQPNPTGILSKEELDQILEIVINCLGNKTTMGAVKSKSRIKANIHVRHITMWVLRENYEMRLTAIGNFFGYDHTTVLSALKKMRQRIDENSDICLRLKDYAAAVTTAVPPKPSVPPDPF